MKLSIGPISRGSLVGFLIGIIPGSAHIISSFVSYGIERRMSQHPERFGNGAIEGVAGPESANNSAATGAFVPMLALGIPTGPITAVMLAAIMVHGISPGPMLITQQPELFWGFVASMYVGNVVLLILNLPLVGLFVNLLRIPYSYLYPTILCFCILGVYSVSNSVVDVWIMLAMGAFGYVLRKTGFEPAPDRARPDPVADARTVGAPVARDVGRQLRYIFRPADRDRDVCRGRRADFSRA